jgi:hypothetical protein
VDLVTTIRLRIALVLEIMLGTLAAGMVSLTINNQSCAAGLDRQLLSDVVGATDNKYARLSRDSAPELAHLMATIIGRGRKSIF